MNNLVSGLAVVAAQEKAMLVESEAFLASVAAKQVIVLIYIVQEQVLLSQQVSKFMSFQISFKC